MPTDHRPSDELTGRLINRVDTFKILYVVLISCWSLRIVKHYDWLEHKTPLYVLNFPLKVLGT